MARRNAALATGGHVDPRNERSVATHAAATATLASPAVAVVTPASASAAPPGTDPEHDQPGFGARAALARHV